MAKEEHVEDCWCTECWDQVSMLLHFRGVSLRALKDLDDGNLEYVQRGLEIMQGHAEWWTKELGGEEWLDCVPSMEPPR